MKMVLLFFCIFLGIILTLILLVIFSNIKLNIKKCDISNIENGKKKKLEVDNVIYLEFYLLGLVKIAKIKIGKRLISKINIKTDKKALKKDAKIIKIAKPTEIIKKLKIKIEKLVLDLKVGTESVTITSYIVAIVSSIIRNRNRYFKTKRSNFSYSAIV